MSLAPSVVASPPMRSTLRLVHEAGLIAVLVMEIAWVVPWLRSLTEALGRLSTLEAGGLLLAFATLSAVIARGARALLLRTSVRTGLLVGALLLSIAIALRLILFRETELGMLAILARSVSTFSGVLELIPNELVVVLAVLYAWRRGIVASVRDPLDPATAAHSFRLGILAFVIHSLVYRLEQSQYLFEALPIYFGAALAGIGLARADRLSAGRGGGRSPFRGRWLTVLLALTTATTALGVMIGNALQAQGTRAVARVAGSILLRVSDVILALLRPVVIAIGALIDLIFRLLREWFDVNLRSPDLSRLRAPDIPQLLEPSPPPAWLVTYGPALRIAGTLALLLVIVLAALRMSRRGPSRGLEPFTDEAETIPGKGSVGASRNLAGQLLTRVQRRRLLAAQVVRRLYQRLLRLAEKRGVVRDPAKTPFEFEKDLVQAFPNHGREVRLLTDAYVRIRYGELPEDETEVRLLRTCLAALTDGIRAR